jgi:hypothetical protein
MTISAHAQDQPSSSNPRKLFLLTETSSHTKSYLKISEKRHRPKPKSPFERFGPGNRTGKGWMPSTTRVERSYVQDKKLRVLSYWFYALVPDEKYGIKNFLNIFSH